MSGRRIRAGVRAIIQERMLCLLRDESGQASTEYLIMMAVTVGMTLSIVKKFVQPILARFAETYSARLQSTLFSKANMHSLRIGGH